MPSRDDIPDDETVVVDRAAVASEDTVVVDRAVVLSDDTVVVGRKSGPGEPACEVDDATVAVDRGSAVGSMGEGAAPDGPDDSTVVARPGAQIISDDVLRVLPSRRSVRGVRPAPVEPDFGRPAAEASGAGAVDAYVPRTIVAAPRMGPQSRSASSDAGGEAALGVRAGFALPSVERNSARMGLLGVALCAGACVVSVVGVVVIVAALVR